MTPPEESLLETATSIMPTHFVYRPAGFLRNPGFLTVSVISYLVLILIVCLGA